MRFAIRGYFRFPLFLFLFFWSSPCSAKDRLTLYFLPSPHGIDWSTPRALLRSTVQNALSGESHSVGHVNIRLECDVRSGIPAVNELTGMTGGSNEEMRDLLRKRTGLGLLFHTFLGHLDRSDEVEKEIEERYRNGKVSFLEFDLQNENCQRLSRYLNEYRERGYDKWYGLSNWPLAGNGSGCSAFGASFLKVAGLMEPPLESSWTQTVRVPRRLVGGKLTGSRVPLLRILGMGGSRWAEPHESHFALRFWDPDRMHRWVQRLWQTDESPPSLSYSRLTKDQALGIHIDAESVPAPSQPIWENERTY